MPTLTLEVPDKVMTRLRTIARMNDCHTQEQAIRLLTAAVNSPNGPANLAARLVDAEPLFTALRELYSSQGSPLAKDLARTLAGRSTRVPSDQTLRNILNGKHFPVWATLQPIVLALHGDEDQFRKLWDDVDLL